MVVTIGIKAQDEFARRIDPLPRDRSNQAQKHRLVFEQTPETAGFHVGDELIVARCAAVLLRLLCSAGDPLAFRALAKRS